MWRIYFVRDGKCIFSWNAPKSNIFIYGYFLVLKLITFFPKCPTFLCSFFPEMPHFSHLILKMGKMGHFRKNEQKKVGHFEKKARDRFENEKRTENEYVRFWGISGKICIALTWKIPPSHAFWGISRYPPYILIWRTTCSTLIWCSIWHNQDVIVINDSLFLGHEKNWRTDMYQVWTKEQK